MGILGGIEDIVDDLPGGIGAGRRIVGGPGDDRIEGTSGSDEILADPVPADDRGGADQVWGFAGDDLIYGFGGDNFIDGGRGDDELIAADGDDEILGGPSDDEMQGGRGTDLLRGGSGSDEVRGGEGDDTLYGDDGDDRVIGSSGNDLIFGGTGGDQLEGREGVDRFAWTSTAEGSDTIADFALALDRFAIGDIFTNLTGDEAELEQHVRFVRSGASASALQVDTDGEAGPAPWQALAVVAGQPNLKAVPLFQVGDLELEGHAPATPFGPLAYVASYPDLIAAFGADGTAGKRHYLANGYDEGRSVTFDGLQYVANYADLQAAFGTDYEAATRHFITNGYNEGRTDQPLAAAADFIV